MPLRFIDHLVFRVSNLEESARFYNAVLDQTPERAGDALVYRIEETLLFFTPATVAQPGPYNKEHIGLNHIAFGVRTLDKLRAIEARLTARQIAHSGIAIDRHGHREYIWLDDPDGLRLEFYLRQEE